jgi:hypothetical protein
MSHEKRWQSIRQRLNASMAKRKGEKAKGGNAAMWRENLGRGKKKSN